MTFQENAVDPSALVKVTTDGTTVTAASQTTLRVRAMYGAQALPGAIIAWSAQSTSGGAQVGAATSVTGADGVASVTVTFSATSEQNSFTASSAGRTATFVFQVQVVPSLQILPLTANGFGLQAALPASSDTDLPFLVSNTGFLTATSLLPLTLSAPFGYTASTAGTFGTYPGYGGNCGSTLGPQASCVVMARFRPTADGYVNASLGIGYRYGGVLATVTTALAGIGAVTFSAPTTSAQYTVPAGCGAVEAQLWGGGGGSGLAQTSSRRYVWGDGGNGGETRVWLSVSPGQVLTVAVGGGGGAGSTTGGGIGGTNGGGHGGTGSVMGPTPSATPTGAGGGGGGYSAILYGSLLLAVAGGGGGSGVDNLSLGGGGGGSSGGDGRGGPDTSGAGRGGTQAAAGAGGAPPSSWGCLPGAGGSGSNGGSAPDWAGEPGSLWLGGGGGGGGYFGGGAGATGSWRWGGGGGSGYVAPFMVMAGQTASRGSIPLPSVAPASTGAGGVGRGLNGEPAVPRGDGFVVIACATPLPSGSPTVVIAPTSSDAWGLQTVGSTVDRTFVVTNQQSGTVTSLQPSASHSLAAPFSFAGGTYPGTGGTCGSSLGPNGSCLLVVRHAPTVPLLVTDAITLSYNDGSPREATRSISGFGSQVFATPTTGTPFDPAGLSCPAVYAKLWGAGGGDFMSGGLGGGGGYTLGRVPNQTGSPLTLLVGGGGGSGAGGLNGGGNPSSRQTSHGGGGGGFSGVQQGSVLALCAGGGGGAFSSNNVGGSPGGGLSGGGSSKGTTGEDGTPGMGAGGGGGGYSGGIGGGSYSGGGGGSGYAGAYGFTATGSGGLPAWSFDPSYVPGAGAGVAVSAGGNGLVVVGCGP